MKKTELPHLDDGGCPTGTMNYTEFHYDNHTELRDAIKQVEFFIMKDEQYIHQKGIPYDRMVVDIFRELHEVMMRGITSQFPTGALRFVSAVYDYRFMPLIQGVMLPNGMRVKLVWLSTSNFEDCCIATDRQYRLALDNQLARHELEKKHMEELRYIHDREAHARYYEQFMRIGPMMPPNRYRTPYITPPDYFDSPPPAKKKSKVNLSILKDTTLERRKSYPTVTITNEEVTLSTKVVNHSNKRNIKLKQSD